MVSLGKLRVTEPQIFSPKVRYPKTPIDRYKTVTSTIPAFRTDGKSSGFLALFSKGKTTEIPSNEKTAVPKNKAK